MEIIQCVVNIAVLSLELFISIIVLVTSIQSLIYNSKRERRELAQAERDKEYHAKRMGALLDK